MIVRGGDVMDVRSQRNKMTVFCKNCGEWIDASSVKTLNIESNIHGQDVLTFICLLCNTRQKSLIKS